MVVSVHLSRQTNVCLLAASANLCQLCRCQLAEAIRVEGGSPWGLNKEWGREDALEASALGNGMVMKHIEHRLLLIS